MITQIRVGKETFDVRAPTSRDDVESALEWGMLYAAMANGAHWKVRRNGKTKTWAREVDRFEIPVKAGLRAYGRITERDIGQHNFVVRMCL
jgi:hypothetical protein